MPLVDRASAPPWARKEHILSGYRPRLSRRAALASVLTVHNETLNVWSHLLGCAWVCWCFTDLEALAAPTAVNEAARVASRVYLLTALLCTASSTAYHLFGPCLSRREHDWLFSLDVNCICVVIGGAYCPGVTFAFRCHKGVQTAYGWLVFALVAAALLATNYPQADKGNRSTIADKLRVAVLVAVVASGLLPLMHFCVLAPDAERQRYLGNILAMFASFAAGYGFYSQRLPERWRPGSFDVWVPSHTWWHLFVLLGIRVWYETCRLFVVDPQVGCAFG